VDQPFVSFINRIKQDLKREIEETIIDQFKSYGFEKGMSMNNYYMKEEHMRQLQYPLKVFKASSKRSIEEWCVKRMRKILELPEEEPLDSVVEQFVNCYEAPDVENKHFLSLKSIRNESNPVIHHNRDDVRDMSAHLT